MHLTDTLARVSFGVREKVFFILLVYLDLVLTLYALHSGFSELNPVALKIFSNPEQLFLIKGVSPLLIAFLVPGKLLIPAIAVLLFVAGWNVKELLLVLA